VATPRKSVFRTIAEAVNAELIIILTAEERALPRGSASGEPDNAGGFVFGNTPMIEHSILPRIQWASPLGNYVTDPLTGAVKDPEAPPVVPKMLLRKQAQIYLWHASEEELEHLMLVMPVACDRSAYGKFFHWPTATFDEPTQAVGPQLKNGVHVARINVFVDIQVNAEIEGEVEFVEVDSTKLRAAITDDLESDPEDETEWQPEQWSG
jgi:hypothetical protein